MKWCPHCKKNVKAVPKMFGVLLCPYCNRILESNYPIEKAGI